MELTEHEHEVLVSVWGEETPRDLRQIDTDELVTMHDRITRAVQDSFEADQTDSLGILLPIEDKLIRVLHERL